jgi:hypothetical protein
MERGVAAGNETVTFVSGRDLMEWVREKEVWIKMQCGCERRLISRRFCFYGRNNGMGTVNFWFLPSDRKLH